MSLPDSDNEACPSAVTVPADLPVSAFSEKGRALPVDRQIRNKKSEIRNTALSAPGNHYAVPGTQQTEDQGARNKGQDRTRSSVLSPQKPEAGGTVIGGSEGSRMGLSHLSQMTREEDDDGETVFMRETLMYEAMDRVDREAYEAIRQTPDAGLEALWQEFLRRDMRNGFPFLEKLGLFGDEPEDPPPEEEEWNEEALLPEFAVVN